MRTSESTDKIFPALMKARESMGAVSKDGFNDFNKYKYSNLESFMKVVSPPLSANGLQLVTSVPSIIHTFDGGKEGKNRIVLTLALRLIHTSGQWVEVDSIGEGVDPLDKATYKAITGGRKYGLACLFDLVTSDDPERFDSAVGNKKSNGNGDGHGALVAAVLEGFRQRYGEKAPDEIGKYLTKFSKANKVAATVDDLPDQTLRKLQTTFKENGN